MVNNQSDKMNKVLSEYINIMGDGGNSSQPTDTEGPKVDILVGVKTENSIEVTVNATDESGIATYEYYLNSEETPRATGTSNSYTYTGLTGGESYTIKVVVTDNAGNSTTVTKVEKTNAVPGAPTVTFNSKTTNSITVQAKSTDADGGNLTYTLYTSTSSSGNYTKSATATGSSGSNVSLTASGLSQYTTYYYYVTVTDQISNNQSSTASQRTYCPGTGHTVSYCPGGTTGSVTCSTCNGDGCVCANCGGRIYWQFVVRRRLDGKDGDVSMSRRLL